MPVTGKHSFTNGLFQDLLKEYHLKRHIPQVKNVMMYGKGIKMGTVVCFKKIKMRTFCLCVSSLDKARRCKSFVLCSNVFAGFVMLLLVAVKIMPFVAALPVPLLSLKSSMRGRVCLTHLAKII